MKEDGSALEKIDLAERSNEEIVRRILWVSPAMRQFSTKLTRFVF